MSKPCPKCFGTGRIEYRKFVNLWFVGWRSRPCSECENTGYVIKVQPKRKDEENGAVP